jgi:hypothetical protein
MNIRYPSDVVGTLSTKSKVDVNLDVKFDVESFDVRVAGPLASIGYPHTYPYNVFYIWNITFQNSVPLLQFTDISLRTYEVMAVVLKPTSVTYS